MDILISIAIKVDDHLFSFIVAIVAAVQGQWSDDHPTV